MRRSFRVVSIWGEKAGTLHPCVKQSLDMATLRRGVVFFSQSAPHPHFGTTTSLFLGEFEWRIIAITPCFNRRTDIGCACIGDRIN